MFSAVLWIRIRIRIGSGSRRAKKTHNRKKSFHFLKCWGCSLWRAGGFSCSLDVLYGGLGISKLQFLIKKEEKKFQLYFFLQILVIKTLDPYPDPDSNSLEILDPDPQHWFSHIFFIFI
jgi:hypothetical protein